MNLQLFGGRGGSSGMVGGGVVNNIGASEKSVSFIKDAISDIKKFGTAQIVVSETKDSSNVRGVKASNPKDSAMEKELTKLADDNGLMVNFKTITTNSKGVAREKVYGGYQRESRQIKQRVMYVYKKGV